MCCSFLTLWQASNTRKHTKGRVNTGLLLLVFVLSDAKWTLDVAMTIGGDGFSEDMRA